MIFDRLLNLYGPLTVISTNNDGFTLIFKVMRRRYTSTLLVALVAFFSSVFFHKTTSAQSYGSVSFDVFYNELSPYGYWDRDAHYGDIWFPDVDANFRPYGTNGYWAMTEYGNTWVSHYDWGWAPFHYGRWVYTNYRGWGWIPGYEWGPAWVDWRSGGGYYGWAPMAPRVGVTVSVGVPVNLWIFLPTRRIYDQHIYRHWSYGQRTVYNRTTIINNTYVVNNHHYYGGPSRRDIERNTGRRVQVRDIRTADRPGRHQVDKRSVSLYRPDRGASNSRVTDRNADTRSRVTQNTNGQRELRIGNNENSNSRNSRTATENRTNRQGTTNSRTVENSNRGQAQGNTRTDRNRTSTERPTVRKESTQAPTNRTSVERNSRQSQNVERSAPQRTPRATQPQQNNDSRQNNTIQRSAPQRNQSREPQRQNSAPVQVHQASSRSSAPTASRQSSPRVERAASTSRSQSSSSGQQRASERTRR